MMRCPLAAMLFLCLPPFSPAAPPRGKPEAGHALTAAEAARGWLSLFDGKTDYGWSKADADEEKGLLVGGTSEVAFPDCELKGEAAHGGSILVGDREYIVLAGPFHIPATGKPSPLVLSDRLALKSIAARPRGLRTILPGPDLAGWRRLDAPAQAARRPAWKVADGSLRVTGGPGALEWTQEHADLLIQADVRCGGKGGVGGVLLRCAPGVYRGGYELCIRNACEGGDTSKPAEGATGAIGERQNARRLVSRDGEPFVLTIIADGTHLATWVNGYQTVAWTDTRPRDDDPRQGRRLEAGTLQLLSAEPDAELEFRRIGVAGVR